MTYARTTFGLLSAVLLASVCLPLPGRDGHIAHLPSVCPFYQVTGLPCPGCGLTRAFVCLGHGRFWESVHWHPIGWLLYGVLLAFWLRAGLTWLLGRPVFVLSPTAARRLSWAGLVMVLGVGVARMGWIVVHHQRF